MLEFWLPKSSAEEAMQRSSHQDARLQLSECKVTTISMQSYNYRDAIPNIFGFNLKYPPTITPYPTLRISLPKLHNYTV